VFGDYREGRARPAFRGLAAREDSGQRSARRSAGAPAADCRELSSVEIQRGISFACRDELAGTENRIAVERKRYQRHSARLQTLTCSKFPQQPFRGHGGIQAERSVLRSFGRIARSSEG